MQQLKYPLPVGLIAELDQYMEGGTCYDVLLFSQIYDIRSEKLSWAAMEKILDCKINRNCGFPRIFGVKEERLRGIMSKGKVKTLGGPLQRIWLRVQVLQSLLQQVRRVMRQPPREDA